MDVLFFYPWRNIFAHALSEVLCHELWCGGWCRPHNLGREALSVCFREWTPVVFHSLGGAVECMEPMGATLLRNIGNVVCTMRFGIRGWERGRGKQGRWQVWVVSLRGQSIFSSFQSSFLKVMRANGFFTRDPKSGMAKPNPISAHSISFKWVLTCSRVKKFLVM